MDSCDELEDQLLSVIQKSVEQRIQCKERNRDDSHNQTIQKLAMMRDKYRQEKLKEIESRKITTTTSKTIEEKENRTPQLERNCDIRSSTRAAFKRLGALYSDNRISSPIHRTEDRFVAEPEEHRPVDVRRDDESEDDEAEEDDEERGRELRPCDNRLATPRPGAVSRPAARSARLAALADTINHWEDDLTRSNVVVEARYPGKKVASGNPSRNGEDNRKKATTVAGSPARSLASVLSPSKKTPQPGKAAWDNAIIATLEAQGFSRCESRQHLVYDYKDSQANPARCISPSRPRPPTAAATAAVAVTRVDNKHQEEEKEHAKRTVVKSPAKPQTSGNRQGGSPVKSSLVRAMAAQFEELSPVKNESTSNVKDPAILSLAERKALFERNGGGAILPKAPFGMPVPSKALNSASSAEQKKKVCPPLRGPVRMEMTGVKSGLSSRVALFEKRATEEQQQQEAVRDPVVEEVLARRREMEDLRNRNRVKKEAFDQRYSNTEHEPKERECTVSPGKCVTEMLPPPPPPPLPAELLHDPQKDRDLPPRKSLNSSTMNSSYPDVKRIRVSPPKPGRLYPSISDIETETETDIHDDEEEEEQEGSVRNTSESSIEDDLSSVSSLGQKIVKVASTTKLRHHSTMKRVKSETDSVTTSCSDESRVLREIDDFLDEALGEPSPKKSRDSSFDQDYHQDLDEDDQRNNASDSSGSCRSTSFEFSTNSKSSAAAETEEDVENLSGSKGATTVQLVHTISLYRKQQQNTPVKPPVMTIKREPVRCDIGSSSKKKLDMEVEEEMVAKRIHDLLIEVSRQQTVIAQATQALNLCCSTVEFAGSTEQVEGEKLLLIAANRRQACLHELQRLRVEKTLRPGGGDINADRGDLTIEQILIPVKMDAVHQAAREEKCQHVICLARCGHSVAASEMIACTPRNLTSDGCLRFSRPLKMDGVYADFAVALEVYTLAAKAKELLPHDVKYHIAPSTSSHKKLRLTPKKGLKSDTKFLISAVESPGGPTAVRSHSFTLAGFIVFSLRDLNRTRFNLNKVPYCSVVRGDVELKTKCNMSMSNMEHRGFLTMFEEVSGFGAWHRRWCLLRADTISYWKYPEDEETKVAMDTIDLNECSTREVGLVSRDICARPHTFLLEVSRPRRPGDVESLVLKSSGETTTIRHMLSADTREDRIEWCNQINRTLTLLRAWGKHT